MTSNNTDTNRININDVINSDSDQDNTTYTDQQLLDAIFLQERRERQIEKAFASRPVQPFTSDDVPF